MIMVGDGLAPRRAAVRTVAGRWRAKGRAWGLRAPMVRPKGPRAAERRPGAPSPAPGTVSSGALNGAVGEAAAPDGASPGRRRSWGGGAVLAVLSVLSVPYATSWTPRGPPGPRGSSSGS